MKIIVLGTRGFPDIQGGVEKHAEELYPRLRQLGIDVTVFGRAPYTGKNDYVYRGVKIEPLSCPKRKSLEAIAHTFLGVLKARGQGCDLLHIHAIGPSLMTPFARLLGLHVVMTHHGLDYDRQKWGRLAKMMLRLGERFGVQFANEVITVSESIARSVEKKYGRTVTTVPNGVTVAGKTVGASALDALGLTPERYILTVGRFVPEKGFHELIQGFERFSAQQRQGDTGWRLVIVGDADHEDAFSRKLKELGRAVAGVVFTGRQTGETLRALYRNAGLFILPSYHEGLPIVLLEALSHGLSCLVSDIPANREVRLESERYFTPGDITAMSCKLREFLGRQDADADCRRRRVVHVTERYDWNRIAERTRAVYEEACRRRRKKGVAKVEQERAGQRLTLRLEAAAETRETFSSLYKTDHMLRIVNLSSGGACVQSPLSEGSHVTMTFRLPEEDEEINLWGEVVWSRPKHQRCGIEFYRTDIDTRPSLNRLAEYLRNADEISRPAGAA